MGNNIAHFESLFGQKFMAPGNAEYFAEITSRYPYFSAAHFFSLLQTPEDSRAYTEQSAKTAIFFNNAYWLQFQLKEKKETIDKLNNADIVSDVQAGETLNNLPSTISTLVETADSGQLVDADTMQLANPSIDKGLPVNDQPVVFPEPANPQNDLNSNSSTLQTGEKTAVPLINDPEKIAAGAITAENVFLQRDEANTDMMPAKVSDEIVASPAEVVQPEEEAPVLDQQAQPSGFKLNLDNVNTAEDQITFQPLHTSDYFASVGIRLSGEIKPSDKLGKQLKSFTEWLKTMKRIHAAELSTLSGQADLSIQKLAEQSNREDEVLTEAMADVLLQQGKTDKALDVYQKLSLLNPSKSAYFAAKIDQLNAH